MRRKNGFTLVELLVVIAIIGILAALVSPALFQAFWSARQTKIKTELDQLHSAIEAFKAKYGSYPPANLTCPSGSANPALTAFVAKAFPRYTVTSGPLATQIYNDLSATGIYQAGCDTTNFNPQRALVFWLSGVGPDVTDPFNRANINITRAPFFTFTQTQLIDASTGATAAPGVTPVGRMVYNAPYGSAAYAYFDYQSYGASPTSAIAYNGAGGSVGPVYISTTASTANTLLGSPAIPWVLTNGTGYVSPYFADVNSNGTIDIGETFCKPQSFQIVSAGQDGAFGPIVTTTTPPPAATYFRLFPIGVGYDPAGADNDNLTNFNEKNSLDAAKP